MLKGFGSVTVAVLYDRFKRRQPTPPSLDATEISPLCSELAAARIVEKIEEELGPRSALGGGCARLKVSLWLMCANKQKRETPLWVGPWAGWLGRFLSWTSGSTAM